MTSNAAPIPTLTEFFASKDIAHNYASAERATGPPARAMILQAGFPASLATADAGAQFVILDNACGTGVVATTLQVAFRGNEGRLKLVCGDFSPPMVEAVKARIVAMEGVDAEARVVDGQVCSFRVFQSTGNSSRAWIGDGFTCKHIHSCLHQLRVSELSRPAPWASWYVVC
ncbi:hypothetical protein DXG03_005597 [Asterophora parasitica]|uniref:Methyltransferase domain-containing protein n=1 Tax=Asterophora parasitica TaxID=117018 RepID=A0A9P7K9M4_9AGAR|nr:hypothetical protein DXG03_005597 [Asterophora parasitica]